MMKRLLVTIVSAFSIACAGTTIIAPEIEIKKDGTIKVAFEASITKSSSTSTTANDKP